MKHLVFPIIFFFLCPRARAQVKSAVKDSVFIQPTAYLYGEGLGLCEFFSINGDLRFHPAPKRILMVHFGMQLLPPAISLYNEDFNAGVLIESGTKKWCGDLGAGATSWISQQQFQKMGMLSTTSCSADTCRPSLRWGPYLSLGLHYRFLQDLFVGFEFTPVLFSAPDQNWKLETRIGFSAGFYFDKQRGAFGQGKLK